MTQRKLNEGGTEAGREAIRQRHQARDERERARWAALRKQLRERDEKRRRRKT